MRNKIRKFGLWLGASMVAMPVVVFAKVGTTDVGDPGIEDIGNLFTKIEGIINYFVAAVALVAVIAIVWGGLQYTTGKVDEAKSKITYGVIGLVVALLAFSIVNIVINLLTK